MKADEVRLYALRGGFLKQSVCYTHFHSNKVFRGDLLLIHPARFLLITAPIAVNTAKHSIFTQTMLAPLGVPSS